MSVYQSFYDNWRNNKGYIPNPLPTEKLYGGHMMRAIGWDKWDRIKIANSWGTTNGDNEFCYVPFTSTIINKVYVAIDMVTEGNLENLQFATVIANFKYPDKRSCNRTVGLYTKVGVLNREPLSILEYEGEFFVMVGRFFDTREEASEYKKSFPDGNLKLNILPICIS